MHEGGELVLARPVALGGGLECAGEPARKPEHQCLSLETAEQLDVLVEAFDAEDHEQGRLARRPHRLCQIRQELVPRAESGQRIGEQLVGDEAGAFGVNAHALSVGAWLNLSIPREGEVGSSDSLRGTQGGTVIVVLTKGEAMSLSEEIARMIRFQVSENAMARESLLVGGAAPGTPIEAIATLNIYCNALSAAVLRLAEEVDRLRGELGETDLQD